ncbi:lipoate--protein ligase, partial [Klebsiella pneumoniae]
LPAQCADKKSPLRLAGRENRRPGQTKPPPGTTALTLYRPAARIPARF